MDKYTGPKIVTARHLLNFVEAIEAACPKGCARDRFNRLIGPRDTNKLNMLARTFQIEDGGQDTLDQAAMIARRIMSLAFAP